MRGQCEGGPDIAMALVAEFRLTLPEQTACQPSILFGQRRHGEELRLRALHGFALRTIRRRYQSIEWQSWQATPFSAWLE